MGFRRSASSVNSREQEQKQEMSPSRNNRLVRPQSARFHSTGHNVFDTSHLDGLGFQYQQAQELRLQQEGRRQERKPPVYPSKSAVKVGIVDDCDDDEEDSTTTTKRPAGDDKLTKKTKSSLDDTKRYGEYSAEEIALRRFMTTVAWGSGLNVVKYNRGRGRVRRVLKFNDEVGLRPLRCSAGPAVWCLFSVPRVRCREHTS